MKYLVALFVTLFFVSCGGYKPAQKFSVDIFDEPVLTKVKLDAQDPDSGIFLQDELSKMVVNRLNLRLTRDVDEAKGYILVNSYTINTTPLYKDSDGNIVRYSVNAAIEFAIKDRYGFWSKNIVSSEYVDVNPQSGVSTLSKEEAGRLAIKKALDEFILAVMQRSRKVGKNKGEYKKYIEKSKEESKPSTPYNEVESFENNTQDNITSNYNNNPFAEDSTPLEKSSQQDFGVKIIPTQSDTLIQDATNYN